MATKRFFSRDVDVEDKPVRQYGTQVDWLYCDVDRFINYWLPYFDRLHGIEMAIHELQPEPKTITGAHKPKPSPHQIHRPRTERTQQIINLLRNEPLTMSEIAKQLGMHGASSPHRILVEDPTFTFVGEKRVGKNPYTKVWGLAEGVAA